MTQHVTNEACFSSEYVQRLKDQYVQLWTSSCMNSSKLTTYFGFKNSMLLNLMLIIYLYEIIEMLLQVSDSQPIVWQLIEVYVKILFKNHVFVHIVKILLRMNYIFYWYLVCPVYKDIRKQLLDIKYYTNPCLNEFNAIVSCGNEEVVKPTAMYLFYAFERRKTMFNE